MVSTNVESAVPIARPGGGLKYRTFGDYQPGEYEMLTNMEIYEEALRTRRPFCMLGAGSSPDVGYVGIPKGQGFAGFFTGFSGFINNRVVATGLTEMWQIGGGINYPVINTLFAPSALPAPPGGSTPTAGDPKGHMVLGAFRYGDNVYYITHKYEYNVVNEIWVFWHTVSTVPNIQTSVLPTNSVKVLTLSNPAAFQPGHYAPFRKFFIHKDRLFILMRDRLYYSKATDPTNFTSPDGGFIDTDSGVFFDAVALSDNIYLSGDSKTYVFNYNTNPATDGFMRPVYTGPAITSLVVHRDQVFAASQSILYRLTGLNFEPVVDLTQVVQPVQTQYITKMESFEESIIMRRASYRAQEVQMGKWTISNEVTKILQFNADNDTISEIELKDARKDLAGALGSICDFTVCPDTGIMYVATYSSKATVSKWRFYYMMPSRSLSNQNMVDVLDATAGVDQIATTYEDGTPYLCRIPVFARIPNVVPSGNKYLLKKFRFIRIQGSLPKEEAPTRKQRALPL